MVYVKTSQWRSAYRTSAYLLEQDIDKGNWQKAVQ